MIALVRLYRFREDYRRLAVMCICSAPSAFFRRSDPTCMETAQRTCGVETATRVAGGTAQRGCLEGLGQHGRNESRVICSG